ncbi:hypothetical protein [Dactylosporangium salmoneum]|uniref:Uncharacterized protein n=1 Tax=Dactylosporangium salmoneum TaxID=53361 RepID=A0ABP5SY27_9ACTN
MYLWFDTLAASPQPPKVSGAARVYFDRPDVDAILRVFVRSSGTTTSIDYWIDLQSSDDTGNLRFWLVLTGAARTTEQYPARPPRPTRDGCWDSMWLSPAEIGLTCAKRRIAPGAISASEDALEDSQVVAGTLVRQEMQPAPYATISTLTEQPLAATTGKQTFFALPGFGTSPIPQDVRSRFPIKLRSGPRWS